MTEYVGETKIAKLNLQDNCSLVLGVNPGDESGCGRITVTESLTYGGRVNLFLATTHPAYSMEERRVTLIAAPLGSNLAGVDFRTSYPNNRSEDVLCSFCVTTNETEGTESYCLVMPRYSTHNKSNEAYDKTCSVQASFQTYWYWDYATDNRTTFDSDTIYLSASDILDQCKDPEMNCGDLLRRRCVDLRRSASTSRRTTRTSRRRA